MKKLGKGILFIILACLIGFFSYAFRTREPIPLSNHNPNANITFDEHIEDFVNWNSLSQLLNELAEFGCADVELNGFYWNTYPCLMSSSIPEYEDLDELTLDYKPADLYPRTSPEVAEQYDLKAIRSWCERNREKHADILFGSKVRFNAIRGITNLMHAHKITFFLKLPTDELEAHSVRIQLYQDRRTKVKTTPGTKQTTHRLPKRVE